MGNLDKVVLVDIQDGLDGVDGAVGVVEVDGLVRVDNLG